MKETLLEAVAVTKVYPGAEEAVLSGANLRIDRGDFTVIMGPSGSGKSTLLYCLSGMDALTSGQVTYRGQALGALSEKRMAALRAREFGFVFQQAHLVGSLTLFENVALAGYLTQGEADARRRADALLARMNVDKARDRLPAHVSGGEAQRAAMARAVVNRPTLLFADEPTGALNRRNSEEVLGLLTALGREGQSILMVTHDVRSAIRGNRILYLEDGKIAHELALKPYEEAQARAREARVSAWLAQMAW